jgi:hypothetical protein
MVDIEICLKETICTCGCYTSPLAADKFCLFVWACMLSLGYEFLKWAGR